MERELNTWSRLNKIITLEIWINEYISTFAACLTIDEVKESVVTDIFKI